MPLMGIVSLSVSSQLSVLERFDDDAHAFWIKGSPKGGTKVITRPLKLGRQVHIPDPKQTPALV
jgi:hypothetical protein